MHRPQALHLQLQLEVAAGVAIQTCVLSGRPEVLWGDVFPRFQVSAGFQSLMLAPCHIPNQGFS